MTPRQFSLRLLMIAALATCAGAWWWMSGNDAVSPDSAATSTAPEVKAIAGAAKPGIPGEVAAPIAEVAAMPARDTPLRDAVHPLQARADAGDGIASCRLSVALMRCQVASRQYTERLPRLERELARHRDKDNPGAAGKVEAGIAALRDAKVSCASLPAGLAERAQHYLRAAAVAGEPSSLFRYAAGAGFDATDGYAYLVTPAFDQWRSEAEAMMQRALAGGRPEAAFVLAFAHADDGGLYAGLVPNDSFQAYAHLRLLHRLFGESLTAFPFPLPQPSVSAADAARAEAMAADWHHDHFGGRQFDLMEVMLSQAAPPWDDGYAASPGHDPCPGRGAGNHD